ncbi:MAG: DEAD/DEAH box helicase [Gemmatimonadetes bacterium]|nr:DEAD/DEAH box helicase [Gemmatimonadota bacterium]MYE15411.1 DEAD/DEAH box helicase [Gemmatimonadota bacterium]
MTGRPFATFFREATGLRNPYPYQTCLATDRRLPDILAVPTGCGKTAAAVLAWAWRRLEYPDSEIRKETPRRLIYCLPMRSLVEQVHEEVIMWFANLGWADGHPSTTAPYRPDWDVDRVPVFRLMGGEEAVDWESHPEREAVLVGTQDMLLSRALNRGYAMKPYRWPMAFGLVNVDAMWILDEVQLMGVGRTTSLQLHQFQRPPQHLRRDSLWMSATIGTASPGNDDQRRIQTAPEWMRTPENAAREVDVLGLGGPDRERLSNVLDGAKRMRRLSITVEDASLPTKLIHCASEGRLVLVIVNRVARAQQLFRGIRDVCATDQGHPEILLLHSRFRPRERAATVGHLRADVPPTGRIVISTQVLEAGVELDADVLVTEICPWPSLVQRLGRLNRRGIREGVIHVLDVPVERPDGGWPKGKADREQTELEARNRAALPYEWPVLEEAWTRVRRLGDDASISSIERVDKKAPYCFSVEGPVLRQHHLDDLFDTDPDLSGGHLDVSRFVRGDSMDLDISVIWRALEEIDPADTPIPHPDEICKVSITSLGQMGSDQKGWMLGLQRSRRRSGAWRAIRLSDRAIRPGDTVMLDIAVGGYDDQLGWVGREESRPSSWVAIVDGHRAWVRSDGSTVDDIDDRIDRWASLKADRRSYSRDWMELSPHLLAAETEAHELGEELVPELADRLATAGRWHDVGKALERDGAEGAFLPFQKMLRDAGSPESPHPRDAVCYAKSNGSGGSCGFRHEVASTLAYLAEKDADDLVAWLVMAHHGKARMTPTPWDDNRMDDVAGVRDGDRVPAVGMSLVGRDGTCALDPGLLLPTRSHPGWQGRAVKLLKEHGPQFLAYLEALVRAADWRASR